MKKILTLALMAVAATTAFAQDNLVKEAKSLFTSGKLDEAAAKLAPALTSAETKDKAAAWNLLNDIKYKVYTNEFQKFAMKQEFNTDRMINALVEGFKAAEECEKYDSQPNEKGKVKIRFRKTNADRYANDRQWLYNGGVLQYQDKNMDGAIKAWGAYIESAKSPLFQEKVLPQDTLLSDATYNTALLAYQQKDYATAKKYAELATKYPDKEDDALNMKLFIQKETAQTKADSLEYLAELKKLHAAKPDKEQFFNLLQEYYSRANDQAALKEWALEETKINANNKMAWALLGEAEMNAENWDPAIEAFKKAADLDPSWIPVVFNTGVCLNSKAIALQDQLMDKKTMNITNANKEKVMDVLRQALVYLEKTRQLDPQQETTHWAYPLYRIYYSLNDKAKMAELEAADPSLKNL
ncbi:MAG: tetratricopeptide repeat protein [Prevotella sp.]|nr:tetratricopeptide repeat protein [Prevotella sp.]